MERNEENLISTGAGIAAHCTHPVTPEHYLFTCFEKRNKDLNFIISFFPTFSECILLLSAKPFTPLPLTNNEEEPFVPITITENKKNVCQH